MVKILRRLGVEVDFPASQTCCGQPAFNSGFVNKAKPLARTFLDLFRNSEYVVVPSGSCGSMLKKFIPGLFRDEPLMEAQAHSLAERTHEFSQFLVNVLGVTNVGARYYGKVAYHASCHLLRELGAATESISLIRNVQGVQLVETGESNQCCGFGGTFCIKYPQISEAILEDKLIGLETCGADVLVACDSGCLMHIAGAMSRRGMKIKPMHIAQLLAQEGDRAS
ncbi:(Fe-S)-binding protein [Dehalococcoidia bacterium]|nr:(Fe-S)-binding protein [Dehalococcoidia bacterium]